MQRVIRSQRRLQSPARLFSSSRGSYQVIVRGRPQDEMPELLDPNHKLGHMSRFIMKDFLTSERRDLEAIVCGHSKASLSFGDLHRQSYSLASNLKKHFGTKQGDVVAVMSPNNINYFACLIGIPLTGAASTPINPLYTKEEMLHQLNLTDAKVVVAHPACMAVAQAAAAEKGIPILNIDSAHGNVDGVAGLADFLMESEDSLDYDSFAGAAGDKSFDEFKSLVTIPFSSGTTGLAKGVMLNHRNVIANVLQIQPSEGKYLLKEHTRSGERGSLLCPLPFFHIYGLVAGLLVPTFAGAKTVFMSQFDLPLFLQIIQDHKITRGHVVPPIALALAKHPMIDEYDLSSLEGLMSGAAPLGGEIQLQASKRLNCIVKQAWGMTELSPAGSLTPDDVLRPNGFADEDWIKNVDTIIGKSGYLTPATEGKIIHPESGEDLESTETGELLLRGPQVMMGYLKNKEATDNTITPDGWLKTGDIGHFTEDGWLLITDRNKELIKYKGFQVPPAELEALLLTMEELSDAVVIPVEDDEVGELPRAYVVKNEAVLQGKDLTEQEVLDYVAERVAPHKKLRGGVRFTESVPKSASGKILRRVQKQIDRGEI